MFKFNELEKTSKEESEKQPTTKVVIELMRHSYKENDKNKPNSELLLTPEGREFARLRGKELNPSMKSAVAGASPMDRAAETAMLVMLADADEITTSDSLLEMENKISTELPVGKKLYRDKRLGFALSKGLAGKAGMEAFKAGKYLEWLVQDSDKQVVADKDSVTTTYLRQAGNIAELLARYKSVGNNFHKLVEDKEKAEKYGDKLERYLVSHQGVAESFVAKVIEIQEGLAARDEFASTIGNGWTETKGIHIEIINDVKGQRVSVTYDDAQGDKKEILLDDDTLATIIQERSELEKACLN